MNCEGPYLGEGFLHKLCPCFNIVFAQLGVITRTRNKFVEIVVASEWYLIINSGIKEAAVRTMTSRKISWWKNIHKKGKNYSYLTYNIVSLSKITGKTESFSRKVSWICELVVKYLENLVIEKICCYIEWCQIKDLLIFILWVIIFTQEKTPRETFICS